MSAIPAVMYQRTANPVADAEAYEDSLQARSDYLEGIANAKYERFLASSRRHENGPVDVLEYVDLGDGPSTEDLAAYLLRQFRAGEPAAVALMEEIAQKYAEHAPDSVLGLED